MAKEGTFSCNKLAITSLDKQLQIPAGSAWINFRYKLLQHKPESKKKWEVWACLWDSQNQRTASVSGILLFHSTWPKEENKLYCERYNTVLEIHIKWSYIGKNDFQFLIRRHNLFSNFSGEMINFLNMFTHILYVSTEIKRLKSYQTSN